MKILVATNHLDKLGGTETFTYTFLKELKKKNDYYVEYFSFHLGETSIKIEEDLKIKFMSLDSYDVIFANHTTCVEYLRLLFKSEVLIIQTCHGIFPELEQPSEYADYHVSISEEIQKELENKGFQTEVILNGIDCERFRSIKPIKKKVKKILSLCQSEEANKILEDSCKELLIDFIFFNKHDNPTWDIEKKINDVDLVVGIGRSAFEAMACGRPIIIYDNRSYFPSYSDGYLNRENIINSLKNNCSGRYYKKKLNKKGIINEINKYNENDGEFLLDFSRKNLNIKYNCIKYIDLLDRIKPVKKYNYLALIDLIFEKINNGNSFYVHLLNYDFVMNLPSEFKNKFKDKFKQINNSLADLRELRLTNQHHINLLHQKEQENQHHINLLHQKEQENQHHINLLHQKEQKFGTEIKRIKRTISYKVFFKIEILFKELIIDLFK